MYRTDGYRIVSDDPMYEIAAFVMDKGMTPATTSNRT